MEILRLIEIPLTVNPRGISARFLIDRPDVQVANLVVEPGQTVEAHVTPVDVFFYVVEGRGTISIGDETGEVKAGDIIVSPAKIPHGLKAAPDSTFSVLVVKTPNPKKLKQAGC